MGDKGTSGRKPGVVRGGAVVCVGPIPIVVGSDASMTKTLMIIGGVLMAIMIVVYLVIYLA